MPKLNITLEVEEETLIGLLEALKDTTVAPSVQVVTEPETADDPEDSGGIDFSGIFSTGSIVDTTIALIRGSDNAYVTENYLTECIIAGTRCDSPALIERIKTTVGITLVALSEYFGSANCYLGVIELDTEMGKMSNTALNLFYPSLKFPEPAELMVSKHWLTATSLL